VCESECVFVCVCVCMCVCVYVRCRENVNVDEYVDMCLSVSVCGGGE
jgi:hypothetical protein